MNEIPFELNEIKQEVPHFDETNPCATENLVDKVDNIKHEPLDIEPNDSPAADSTGDNCFTCPDPTCNFTSELDGVLSMHIRLQHEDQDLGLIEPPTKSLLEEDDSVVPTIDITGPIVLLERINKKKHIIHTCSRCGTGFRKLEVAQSHIKKVHMVVKRFTCSVCGKGFDRSGDLEIHTRVHTGERPYKCPAVDCDYSASLTNTLQRHVRRRHKELVDTGTPGAQDSKTKTKKPRTEKVSKSNQKSAKKSNKLNTIITRSKKHECVTCRVEFTKFESLRAHRNAVHSKKKTFNCTYCEASFPSSRILSRHILQHGEVQSYPCTIEGCQFTFISEDDQMRHLKRHEKKANPNLRPFGCSICGKQFELKCGLVRHISALHPKEVTVKQEVSPISST